MKIFLSFLQSKIQHPIAAYSFWEFYIKNGIEEAGFEWIECPDIDWAQGLVNQSKEDLAHWKTITWEKTIRYLKENPIDLFLSYLYPHQVDEQAILELKKLGIYCVNFFCDNVRMFKKAPIEYRVFDLNWVPEYKALSFYKKDNQPYVHLPMPMWVEPKYRVPAITENQQISFVGSKDIQRQLFFDSFIKQGSALEIDLYGNAWLDEKANSGKVIHSLIDKVSNQVQFLLKHGSYAYLNKLKQRSFNPPISNELKKLIKGKPNFENYIKITRESMVTIGINRYPSFNFPLDKPDTYSRLRDLEAPMLGACYLTEYTQGLEEFYEIGEEIEVFSTVSEMIVKLEVLSADPKKRSSLRKRGQKRALSNDVVNSLKQIKKLMNG